MNYTITNKEELGQGYQLLQINGMVDSEYARTKRIVQGIMEDSTFFVTKSSIQGTEFIGLRGNEYIEYRNIWCDEEYVNCKVFITAPKGIIHYLVKRFKNEFQDSTFVAAEEDKTAIQ